MPIHFEIKYSDSNIPNGCVEHSGSNPLELETSYPDWFDHDPGGGPENVDTITVIFSKDPRGNYPPEVTIDSLASHAYIYVNAPTGSSTYSSNVSIINRSGLSCQILVTCTASDSTEETWLFENSYCVDQAGQPAACPQAAMDPGTATPAQLKIKVKRQPTFSCPT